MTRPALLKYLTHPVSLAALLGLLSLAMYGKFLHNPLIFDDLNFFDSPGHPEYLKTFFSFDFRWLPYASFEWTRVLLGNDIVWYRGGNLGLHIAAVILLFFFLRKLFEAVIPSAEAEGGASPLAPMWLAFFGALIFALHPVAVYAAAYLIQRSILMATVFALAMWLTFLQGATRRNQWWLAASALFYFFALVSKEHAIAAPAVAFALLLLLHKPDRATARQFAPIFLVYAALAVFAVVRLKSGHIIGEAYEPRSANLLGRLAVSDGFDLAMAYPLSVLTQSLLFFKYLLLWIVPNPSWMSIDMFEPFATKLSSWPHVFGSIAFLLYGVLAIRLLFKRGKAGLLGFGLLCPWLMFVPEFSTVRIQESFVLYRSYLWMPCLFACLPYLFQNIRERLAVMLLAVLVLSLPFATWERLTTFSTPLRVWNDAARLIAGKEGRPGVERIYHNRGLHLLKSGYPDLAIQDFNKAISLLPQYLLAINDRGAAYLTLKKYPEALADFNSAIALNSQHSRSYLGRALAYEGMGKQGAAMQDYGALCMQGYAVGCSKIDSTSRPTTTITR
jgi:tetratricopeptide (TPR) repeat protein